MNFTVVLSKRRAVQGVLTHAGELREGPPGQEFEAELQGPPRLHTCKATVSDIYDSNVMCGRMSLSNI